jgi:hypothetical protein
MWVCVSGSGGGSDLSDVVKVSVWDLLQLLQFSHLIQHLMEMELRLQEVQPSVAVGLSARRRFGDRVEGKQ